MSKSPTVQKKAPPTPTRRPATASTTRPRQAGTPPRAQAGTPDKVKVEGPGKAPSTEGRSLVGGIMNWASTTYDKAMDTLGFGDKAKSEAPAGQATPVRAEAPQAPQLQLKDGELLKRGQADADQTRTVQEMLKKNGAKDLDVDGVYGRDTQKAVADFQKKQGIKVDGIVGPETQGKLNGLGAKQDQGSTPEIKTDQTQGQTTGQDPKPASKFELGEGQRLGRGRQPDAEKTTQLQELLKKNGADIDVDGKFGRDTERAVRDFQKKHNLDPDGVVGPDTQAVLNGEKPPSGGRKPNGTDQGGKVDQTDVDTSGTNAQLAQRILNSDRIDLLGSHVSGVKDDANALANIKSAANGGPVKRSRYGNAPGGNVKLSPQMLKGMLELSKKYKFRVTEIAGGSHSRSSRHYSGVGFDIDRINGRPVNASNPYWKAFLRDARKIGATELLGPGHRGHSTHLHVAWPR